jgi:hypothetical protein
MFFLLAEVNPLEKPFIFDSNKNGATYIKEKSFSKIRR